MAKILFYSGLSSSFLSKLSKRFVVDYFDVEAQKILHLIGYNYKMNPTVYEDEKALNDEQIICVDIDRLNIHDVYHIPSHYTGVLLNVCKGNR